MSKTPLTISLADARDRQLVGGKACGLGDLIRAGLRVPNGFVVTTAAFKERISEPDISVDTVELSQELKEQLAALWDQGKHRTVAVRSSATIEDGESESFAGMFVTRLNISSVQQLFEAILDCWSGIAIQAHGYSQASALHEMAVVVQDQVSPTFAGVWFTQDPTIETDEAIHYFEWVDGLGEDLVSGTRLSGRGWVDDSGRLRRLDCFGDDTTKQPTAAQISTLQESIAGFAAKAGNPRLDIEYAICKEGTYFLQVRPITTRTAQRLPVPPWALPGRPAGGWSDTARRYFDVWDEYNPRTVTPLDFDLFMKEVWQSSVAMLAENGEPYPDVDGFVRLLDNVPVAIDPSNSHTQRNDAAVPSLIDELERVGQDVRRMRHRLNEVREDSRKLLELLEQTAECYRRILVARMWTMNEWIEHIDEAGHEILTLLKDVGKTGAEADDVVSVLGAAADHDTHRMNSAMHAMVVDARRNPGHEPSRAALDEFIEQFGHFEFGGELLSRSRDAVKAQVRSMASSTVEPTNLAAQAEAKSRAIEAEVLALLKSEDDRRNFRQAVEQLRQWVSVRETSKTRQDLPLPLIKDIVDAMQPRVKRALGKASDVYLLTLGEVRQVLSGQTPSIDFNHRTAILAWKEDASWLPSGFEEVSDDGQLVGMGVSNGTVQGTARVVGGLSDFALVEEGEIVVAFATNPLWTQLFARIGGIVVENGGRLSHAAIVAREYGIPAVVGLPKATTRIKTGDVVHIDGTAGLVTLINDHTHTD